MRNEIIDTIIQSAVDIADSMDESLFFKPLGMLIDLAAIALMAAAGVIFV